MESEKQNKRTKKKRDKQKTQTPKYREQTDGCSRRAKVEREIKGIKSTLILMSTEECIQLLNHYTVYLKRNNVCQLYFKKKKSFRAVLPDCKVQVTKG